MLCRGVVGLALVVGCGRIEFDARRDAPALDDGVANDASDASAVACGDGVCEGNAGELCATCNADCKTREDVCGNGDCSVTEDGASCFADCGPTPWPWQPEEAELVSRLNDARAAGIDCGGGPVVRAAIPVGTFLVPGAREMVWEQVHQNQLTSGADSLDGCNGRTVNERMLEYGATPGHASVRLHGVGATPAIAISQFIGSSMSCSFLIDPAFTVVAPGVAAEGETALILLFD